jgi:bifunctional oligoribonuclease and PAP phosphatase NrnA
MLDTSGLKDFLDQKRTIFITTHLRPDGDAIGSILALYLLLKSNGHEVTAVIPSEYPYYFEWFPAIKEILNFQTSKDEVLQKLSKADIVFAVDFNQLKRNGDLGKIISETNVTKVLIDHHTLPDDGFDFTFSDTSASASAELVFEIIRQLDPDQLSRKDIATCLYAGIVTDCGMFKYPSTTSRTHAIASRLLESGIEIGQINTLLFDNFQEKRLRYWGHCFSEKLQVNNDLHLSILTISKNELTGNHLKTSDLEGLAGFPLILDNIYLSALFIEREKYVKVSFRSKFDFPTNLLARKYFNGGGHLNASGGEIYIPLEESVAYFMEKINEFEVYLKTKKIEML